MRHNEYTGFVINRKNLNDSDKIVRVLTKYDGKLSFIAKGVRKPKAKLQSQLEPLAEIKFRVIGNNKLPIIVGAKALYKNRFFDTNIEASLAALFLTEVIEIFSIESMPNENAYNIYSAAITNLYDDKKISLMLSYYLINLLKAYGIEPNISPGLNNYWLDFTDGTLHEKPGNNSVAVKLDIVKLWYASLNKSSKLIEKLKVEPSTLRDSLGLLVGFIQNQTDRKIKSVKVISESTNLLQAS